jgi:lipopolysaccharide/colanic/teichoic acid biosynthesis glycosyltransferase
MEQPASNPFFGVFARTKAGLGEPVVKPKQSKGDKTPRGGRSFADQNVLDEPSLHRMISLERKRTERSKKPFLLMLLNMKDGLASEQNGKILNRIFSALAQDTRETDVMGWYRTNSIVCVMFTELNLDDRDSILRIIMNKASDALRRTLGEEYFERITISFHLFPEEWNSDLPQSDRPSNPTLYPDLSSRDKGNRHNTAIKRAMDVVGSIFAIILFSPLFCAIAAAVKLTSKGPVLFRQKRIGQYGVPFMFVKFRSMYVNNDATIHKEYVTQLIAGQAQPEACADNGKTVYKLTTDRRITRVGRFLRRTSLDELPQFFHVLRGEMSLVGPRPPIAYEVEAYDIWHRRRVLEAKPGITGLWQVNGRSRVKFDDMVRLDLQYANNWSPWLDLKILLRTPAVVLFGDGAH